MIFIYTCFGLFEFGKAALRRRLHIHALRDYACGSRSGSREAENACSAISDVFHSSILVSVHYINDILGASVVTHTIKEHGALTSAYMSITKYKSSKKGNSKIARKNCIHLEHTL